MRDHLVPSLDRYLGEVRDQPFEYGKLDCILFAAQWAELATHREMIPPGLAWHDEASATAAIALAGAVSLKDAVSLSLRAIPITSAQLGDIAMYEADGQQCIGICIGSRCLFMTESKGLRSIRLASCALAWAVI